MITDRGTEQRDPFLAQGGQIQCLGQSRAAQEHVALAGFVPSISRPIRIRRADDQVCVAVVVDVPGTTHGDAASIVVVDPVNRGPRGTQAGQIDGGGQAGSTENQMALTRLVVRDDAVPARRRSADDHVGIAVTVHVAGRTDRGSRPIVRFGAQQCDPRRA